MVQNMLNIDECNGPENDLVLKSYLSALLPSSCLSPQRLSPSSLYKHAHQENYCKDLKFIKDFLLLSCQSLLLQLQMLTKK